MFQADVIVAANRKLKNSYCLLELKSKQICRRARPGQFVHIHCPTEGVFFRRPLCIAAVKGDRFAVLCKVIGPGTKYLAERKKGDTLNILGPLGSSYKLPAKNEKIVFVAGGSGIASLNFLAERIKPLKGVLFYGARTLDEFAFTADFKKKGWDIRLSTDDGSMGAKGFITGLFLSALSGLKSDKTVVYMCGPESMLRAAAGRIIENNIKFYCSMETVMACGVGVCQGCAVKTANHKHALCCKDGPVFNGADIDWY